MEVLGIKFAPLNVPMKRRLQTLTVAAWFVLVAFGDFWGTILTFYLLLNLKTILYVLLPYFAWMYYDWDTRDRGGRSGPLSNWMKGSVFFRYFCDYFPIKLVKTVDLDPTKSYLFITMPHGIISMGIAGAFGSDALNCKKIFPGLDMRPLVLDQHFKIPFFREIALNLGSCSCNAKSLDYLLSTPPKKPYTGRATVLIVGGASEALESKPGTNRLLLKRRKGFIKLALKHGTPLVPVFSFGETNLFDQVCAPEGSRLKRIQNFIRKYMGLAPVIFMGRGFFQYSFGILPNRNPLNVVVGKPMEVPKMVYPTIEEIDEYHEKFVNHFIEFFETEKSNYMDNPSKPEIEFL